MDSILIENLISPITLAFLLGILATLIRSDLEIPEPVIRIFAIFLLFSIGLQGGRELATADLGNLSAAARRLDISPAVASAGLKRLELQLQVRLQGNRACLLQQGVVAACAELPGAMAMVDPRAGRR